MQTFTKGISFSISFTSRFRKLSILAEAEAAPSINDATGPAIFYFSTHFIPLAIYLVFLPKHGESKSMLKAKSERRKDDLK